LAKFFKHKTGEGLTGFWQINTQLCLGVIGFVIC